MILNLKPPPNKDKLLQWVLKNPEAAHDYFRAVYALSRIAIRTESNKFPPSHQFSDYVVTYTGRQAVITIPLIAFS